METHLILFYLLSVFLPVFLANPAPQDVCDQCKRMEDCPRFTEMTRELQQKWMQDYPCDGSESIGSTLVPGFSPFAKGDLVCCPSPKVWGISEDNVDIVPGGQDAPETSNRWYNDQSTGITYTPQPRLLNNIQNGYFNGDNAANNYYGYDQCPVQSTPPNPESGCCGVDLSVGNKITDLQQFLQYRPSSPYRDFGSNYPRYPRENSPDFLERKKRDESNFDELGITLDDRIAGGIEADFDQYPWTVFLSISFLSRKGRETFVCGGSLISSNFILTAAHCMVDNGAQLENIDVTLSEYDRRTFPRDCITIRGGNPICIDNLKVSASDVYIHPQFIEEFLINDVALIRLRENVPYTKYIRPICLPPINIDSPQFSNLPLATAGWGLNVSVESNIKQHTVIYMVPKNECSARYTRLTPGHLCASGRRAEDTCKGDSGGPVMMLYQGIYYVVGIVSGKTAAFPCGTPVPSLYANVYVYLDWIRNYVR